MPKRNTSAGERPGYLAPTIDAAAMKAFAHPLRMAMYDYLNDHGAATATMLARHTGESTGQTSYHLRQLERHGFVTDDPSRGTGRERWWTAVGFSMDGHELAKDAATRPAVETMLRNQIAQQAAALGEWFGRSESEDPQWVQTTTNNRSTITLNVQEAAALNQALMTTLQEHIDLSKERQSAGETGSEDTRRVRVYLDIFPLPRDD